jgi:hypothetical protein
MVLTLASTSSVHIEHLAQSQEQRKHVSEFDHFYMCLSFAIVFGTKEFAHQNLSYANAYLNKANFILKSVRTKELTNT